MLSGSAQKCLSCFRFGGRGWGRDTGCLSTLCEFQFTFIVNFDSKGLYDYICSDGIATFHCKVLAPSVPNFHLFIHSASVTVLFCSGFNRIRSLPHNTEHKMKEYNPVCRAFWIIFMIIYMKSTDPC